MESKVNRTGLKDVACQDWLELVREQVNSLRFGVVEIVVHDGRVVQIEKTERVRLDKKEAETRPGRPG
jgi:hypothetical protein